MYLRRLGAFCKTHVISPAELASMDTKRIDQLIMDHVTEVERKFTGGYIKCTFKAVKSWLAFSDLQISRGVVDLLLFVLTSKYQSLAYDPLLQGALGTSTWQ